MDKYFSYLINNIAGRGILGTVFPGCAETYESELQSSGSGDPSQCSTIDRHQKLRRFREGDVIAMPPGVAHWIYNDGDSSIISVSLLDSSSNSNLLDQNYWVCNNILNLVFNPYIKPLP